MADKPYDDDDRAIQDAEYAKRYDAVNYGGGGPKERKEHDELHKIITRRKGGSKRIKELQGIIHEKYKKLWSDWSD